MVISSVSEWKFFQQARNLMTKYNQWLLNHKAINYKTVLAIMDEVIVVSSSACIISSYGSSNNIVPLAINSCHNTPRVSW